MTDPPRARDLDRQAVYDAEDAAFGGTTMDEALTWDELAVVLAAVTASPWFASLGIPRPALARGRRGALRSSADGTRIVLSEAGLDAATLVHEVAHHVDHHLRRAGTDEAPAHGPTFRATELRVAAVVGGAIARDQLAEAFRHRRLPVADWPGPEPEVTAPRALRGAIPLAPGGRGLNPPI